MNNSAIGSSFESFLEDEDVETNAVKRVIALQMQESLNREHLTKTELAARLEISRAAIDRLLEPYNESIILLTLKKAASIKRATGRTKDLADAEMLEKLAGKDLAPKSSYG